MQLRSTKLRGVVALAAGALAAGAMTVPMVAFAPQAQAAVQEDVAFSCAYTSFNFPYTTDVDVSAAWDSVTDTYELTAELQDFANPAPGMFVNFPDVEVDATLETTIGGQVQLLQGTHDDQFVGGQSTDMPTVTAAVAIGDMRGDVVVTGFEADITSNDPAKPLAATLDCAPASAVTIEVIDADLLFGCDVMGTPFPYEAEAAVAAVRNGSNVDVSVELSHMPNASPVPLSGVTMAGSLSAEVAGAPTTLTGSNVQNMVTGVPVDIPKLSASVASAAGSVDMLVQGFTLTAKTSGAGDIPIVCTLAEPVQLGDTTVTNPPVVTPPPPAESAACTAAKASSAALAAKATKLKKKAKKAKGAKKVKLTKKFKAAKKKAKAAAGAVGPACA